MVCYGQVGLLLCHSDCDTAVGNVRSVVPALKTENTPNSQIHDTHL